MEKNEPERARNEQDEAPSVPTRSVRVERDGLAHGVSGRREAMEPVAASHWDADAWFRGRRGPR